ncbi:hypothetical protein CEXT_409101 [Caerostris extrusa]|uniref:Uncharacterized protein n=1 Tax=Caerostris extrusa TaxID=172846 RepID=A0AAV4XW03_CAEEX|nr:hypothetical protein CEXT_409101 [Caerostris extrusa]
MVSPISLSMLPPLIRDATPSPPYDGTCPSADLYIQLTFQDHFLPKLGGGWLQQFSQHGMCPAFRGHHLTSLIKTFLWEVEALDVIGQRITLIGPLVSRTMLINMDFLQEQPVTIPLEAMY